MQTRNPAKKGYEFFGDVGTAESFSGQEFDLFKGGNFVDFLFFSGKNIRIDTLSYDIKYNGSEFFPYTEYLMSIGFYNAARESTEYTLDPTDTTIVEFNIINETNRPVDFIDYVERVYFNDGVRILYYRGIGQVDPAFAVKGLYEYLGCDVPDKEGFKFWLNSYDELDVPLVEIAQAFIEIKAEAAQNGVLTADPSSNQEFVTYLYRSILERPADQEGLTFWTQGLDSGQVSRGEVLVQFIDVNWETDWYNAITGANQPFGGINWIPLG